jgi:protein-S-isoprenylcysteine O-methyltransferase Ste14
MDFARWHSVYALQSLLDLRIGCAAVIWSIIWHIWAKRNIRYMWSDGIEIKDGHQLITSGAYSLSRHPMYASLFLWCLGASLLMFNWITLTLTCLVLLPLLILRAKDEEKELIDVQPDYVLYQQNVRMLYGLHGKQDVVDY